MDKGERGKGGGREGEIMDNSGGRGVFLRNWDGDLVGERSRARGIEEGRKKKRQMKKYQNNSYNPYRRWQTTQSKMGKDATKEVLSSGQEALENMLNISQL